MYGLVNRAIKDLVITTTNAEVWKKIHTQAGFEEEDFQDSVLYDDEVTISLVAAASKELNVLPEQILHDFGRHWILYTGREGWASLFSLAGNSMQEFLEGLDSMHARVQIAMPEGKMPQFNVIEKPDHLILEYHSTREGLAPMVLGLLDGLAEQFNEIWEIDHCVTRADQGFDTFTLRQVKTEHEPDKSIAA